MLRRSHRSDVADFLAARAPGLQRTALLLTGDPDRAEDLVQVGLADVCASWARGDVGPELTARRAMVRSESRWWLRRRDRPGRVDAQDRLAEALSRLSSRQRAALVLREHDRLSGVELAVALDVTEAAALRLADRAVQRLGIDAPAAALAGLADRLALRDDQGRPPTVRERLDDAQHRADVRRAWRRTEVLASLLVATAATVVVVLAVPAPPQDQDGRPPQQDMVEPPPRLAGFQLPPVVRANDVDYEYFRSEQGDLGGTLLRVAVAPEPHPMVLAWASTKGTPGTVRLTVDGAQAAATAGGGHDSGLLLSARKPHLVTLTATSPGPATRLGLAIYEWPSP